MIRDTLLNNICPGYRTLDCSKGNTSFNCNDCKRIMSEWFDEYDKHVIEQYKANTRIKDTIREIHDRVAQEMYCKGIDDLCKAISIYGTFDYCGNVVDVFEVAEQLKEQIC